MFLKLRQTSRRLLEVEVKSPVGMPLGENPVGVSTKKQIYNQGVLLYYKKWDRNRGLMGASSFGDEPERRQGLDRSRINMSRTLTLNFVSRATLNK